MNDIFTLECIWLRLDGPSVIALRQTCTLGEKMSIQYRPIDVLIWIAGSEISRYFNYYTYFSARHTCLLWSQALPAKGLNDRINQAHKRGHHAIVQALDDSLCWVTRHRFQRHYNAGIIVIDPYDISKPSTAGLLAFESLTFHVSPNNDLEAELLIGGIHICDYFLAAQSNDYELLDKVFTMPLIIDVDWAWTASMKWHDIEIRSNCPVTVGLCIQEQIHSQNMKLFMSPQIYNQTSPEVIHYLSQSPYRFNRDFPSLYYVRWNCMNFPFTR